MRAYKFGARVKEDGCIDFQTKIPEIRGEKINIIIIESNLAENNLTAEDIMKTVEKDWADWNDTEEDIYDEYRKYTQNMVIIGKFNIIL